MTQYDEHVRRFLADFIQLGNTSSSKRDVVNLPDSRYVDWLQRTNGGHAYNGALRLFPYTQAAGLPSIDAWNSDDLWKRHYGRLAPRLQIFAEDAFGQQFAFDQSGNISIFWVETGEIESLDFDFQRFLELIAESPDSTISFNVYRAATQRLAVPKLSEHFAFKVETAVGGSLEVDNLRIMDAVHHMRALGSLAQQIADVPPGTRFVPKR